MRSRLGPAGIAIGLSASLLGCAAATPPLPAACTDSPVAFERALGGAPGPVRLTDGSPISACLDRAHADAALQQVGTLLTAAADQLAARAGADPTAALELGYLVGAARRGASHTNGVASQLRQRIEAAAALRDATAPSLAALHRGIVAGQSSG